MGSSVAASRPLAERAGLAVLVPRGHRCAVLQGKDETCCILQEVPCPSPLLLAGGGRDRRQGSSELSTPRVEAATNLLNPDGLALGREVNTEGGSGDEPVEHGRLPPGGSTNALLPAPRLLHLVLGLGLNVMVTNPIQYVGTCS